MNYGFVYALIGVFLWSSAATIAGILENSANFLTITLALQIGGFIFFFIWFRTRDKNAVNNNIKSLKNYLKRKKIKTYIVFNLTMFSLFITLYYLSFYYSIQNSPKIQANILNYIWPMLTPLFGTYIFKNSERKIGYYELSLLLLSFSGAILVAWDISSGNPFSNFHNGYIFALLAALFAALYLNFIFNLKRFVKSTPILYMAALGLAFPFTLIASFVFNIDININLSSIPWLLYLSIIVFGGGQYLLVKSIEIDNMVTISAVAYLTPLFSSLMLNAFLDVPYTETIIIGGMLIVFSNILLSNSFSLVKNNNR